MSELASRLARLRGQAGLSQAKPSSRGDVPVDHALRESLRRLTGLRDRAIGRIERGSRDVPGDEIAPGLVHALKATLQG